MTLGYTIEEEYKTRDLTTKETYSKRPLIKEEIFKSWKSKITASSFQMTTSKMIYRVKAVTDSSVDRIKELEVPCKATKHNLSQVHSGKNEYILKIRI